MTGRIPAGLSACTALTYVSCIQLHDVVNECVCCACESRGGIGCIVYCTDGESVTGHWQLPRTGIEPFLGAFSGDADVAAPIVSVSHAAQCPSMSQLRVLIHC
jgi:hypothetical protein